MKNKDEDILLKKSEVLSRYNIDRKTFDSWSKSKEIGLPVIRISRNAKYCRLSDLKDFEERMKENELI
jgi:hypothetical protein